MLSRLADLAEGSGAAVLLVSHHRKVGRGPAVYRTLGSLAFTAMARAAWSVVRDPTDAERRLLVPVKMNLGPQPGGLAFRVKGSQADVGVLEWEEGAVEVMADEVGVEAYAEADREDRLVVAKRWLDRELSGGARRSSELQRGARLAGISRPSLWEAKRALKVRAVRRGSPGSWWWELPMEHIPLEYTEELLDRALSEWGKNKNGGRSQAAQEMAASELPGRSSVGIH